MADRVRSGSVTAPVQGQPGWGAAAAGDGWRSIGTAALIFLTLFVVYTANFRLRGSGDSLPTRVLPFSLLREGDLDLDEFSWERTAAGHLPYYLYERDGHRYSLSTIATSLVITPLYAGPAWWLAHGDIGYDDVRARVVIAAMERIAAAALTALGASLLFGVLRRLTEWRWALVLALVYALGAATWSISSQALWPHALAQLTLIVLCHVLIAPQPTLAALGVAGLAAGVAVANRPQMLVFAALAFAFVCVTSRRRALAFAAAPALIGTLLVAYNWTTFSTVAGGYGSFNHFDGPLLEGLLGLFVSPNRGVLVYTPIMIFACWGAVQVWRTAAPPWLRWLTIGVVLHLIVHAKFTEWWAGYTYGPRYLVDVLPALTLFLVYGLVPLCRGSAARVAVGLLALYGVGVQAIGVYAADDRWDREPVPLERAPNRVWDWADLQIVRCARNGLHPGELAGVMIDAFRDPVPARVAALEPEQLRAWIVVRGVPRAVAPNERVRARVRVKNRAAVAWPAFNGETMISSRYLVFLMARWFAGGVPEPGLGDVVLLPQNLAPGERTEMRLDLQAPSRPGDYELELRVTQAVDGTRGIIGPGEERIPVRVRRRDAQAEVSQQARE